MFCLIDNNVIEIISNSHFTHDIFKCRYSDVITGMMASQITSLTIVYSTIYSEADQRKHQSSASLAFVWGIPQWLVNSPHKWPVTRKMFSFDDIIMHFLEINCPMSMQGLELVITVPADVLALY